jgi:hypothetical protein
MAGKGDDCPDGRPLALAEEHGTKHRNVVARIANGYRGRCIGANLFRIDELSALPTGAAKFLRVLRKD